jgi:hypothetical protein
MCVIEFTAGKEEVRKKAVDMDVDSDSDLKGANSAAEQGKQNKDSAQNEKEAAAAANGDEDEDEDDEDYEIILEPSGVAALASDTGDANGTNMYRLNRKARIRKPNS